MVALILSLLNILPNNVMINFLSTTLILLCMSILLLTNLQYVNQIPCGNNPQNVFALDPDTDQYFVSTPEADKKDLPQLFQPTQIHIAICPNKSPEFSSDITHRSLRIGFYDYMLNHAPF